MRCPRIEVSTALFTIIIESFDATRTRADLYYWSCIRQSWCNSGCTVAAGAVHESSTIELLSLYVRPQSVWKAGHWITWWGWLKIATRCRRGTLLLAGEAARQTEWEGREKGKRKMKKRRKKKEGRSSWIHHERDFRNSKKHLNVGRRKSIVIILSLNMREVVSIKMNLI